MAILTAVGVLVAAVQAFGVFPSDFVGVASALIGAFEAWRQSEHDQQTAETYRQAVQQLAQLDGSAAAAQARDGNLDEQAWLALVDEAERVLTSEHQQWLLRRKA